MTVIWLALLSGLVIIYVILGRGAAASAVTAQETLSGLVGLGPLIVSIVIRWLVLPRFTEPVKALPVFIVGLATAESCGIMGIFLGGPYQDHLFILGVLGIMQFAPFLMPRLFRPPGSGFRAGT